MWLGIRRLNEILLNPAECIYFLNTLTVYWGNSCACPSYWRNVSAILRSICENASPSCGVYFTLSFPNFYLNTIFDIVFRNTPSYESCSRIISQADTKPSYYIKWPSKWLGGMYVFSCLLSCSKRSTLWFSSLKGCSRFPKGQLNGEYYFIRIEVQARDALHRHGLVTLRDQSQTVELVWNYENSAKRMIELLSESNNLRNLINPIYLHLFSLSLKSKLWLETLHDHLMTTIYCAPQFVFDIFKEGYPSY